nr:hypothetical protein [Tanacetum cinerariifolium]
MIRAQVGDLSSHTTKYSSPALTQKVFANMRMVGKGCFRVETPFIEGVASVADDAVPAAIVEPSIPSPTPPTQPPPSQYQPSTSQGRIIADMDAYVDVTLKDIAKDVVVDAEIEENDEVEPAELQEVVKVVTTAKFIIEVVTAANATITAAAPQLTTAAAPTLTTAPSAARRRKGVVITDPRETATPSTIIHSEDKSVDKGKRILVKEPKPLKKQAHIEQDEAFSRELEKTKEQMKEEDNKALKRISESQEDKAAKKQKLDEEVVELKRHLQIVPNDDDDVYTEATPLARKVPVVDYEIYTENNKPYYKIIRADGSLQLFLGFLILLRNFDREDLKVLWEFVKERFASSKPKNFSDDFLLNKL